MLVIRRRAGEAIVLNGDIEIEVIEISRTRVKLGVKAPREVSVARRESAALAADNRSALELMRVQGRTGLNDLLVLISNLSEIELKRSGDSADKVS